MAVDNFILKFNRFFINIGTKKGKTFSYRYFFQFLLFPTFDQVQNTTVLKNLKIHEKGIRTFFKMPENSNQSWTQYMHEYFEYFFL